MSSANPSNINEVNASNLFATRIGLSDDTRAKVVAIINERLADLIDLQLVIKQAHWNLKGSNFIGVHEMLDGFRAEVDGFVDSVAERATQLGGTALGTVQAVGQNTNLNAYPTNIHQVEDHLKALADHYGDAANLVRKAIDDTDELGDQDTSDLFTEVSRGLDKNLWFIESHLQK
ncbi:DNA starvation/stationary phase protection protein Dps [Carnimonas nigrificans]|uniref:DNA starvation/stationary phase protection protein Dps n=1 Tax=Carnimonas nigrificans TaxID=64323 RepID=UPI00046EBC40|nr:DNA starvation/stationary phase protection protein Dps [Carnimonas nigrificans]